jgi:hypothetical protein
MGEKMSLTSDLRYVNQDYHSAVALKDAGSGVAGQVLKTGKGGQNGALCIIVRAASAVSIAASKALTITVKDGAAEDSLASKQAFTVSGAKTYAAGVVVWDFVLPPSINEWTGVTVTCDDTAATGALDVYLKYLAR